MDADDKHIDEALKEAGNNFAVFVTGLSMQALVSLGEIPNPATNKKEQNPNHAKYIIDALDMLKDKTNGNLSIDEEKILDNILYELRMKYLKLTKEK